ncbi:hypothetical protein E1A91_D05G345600v1 [Gossypium mustelinum]|uniref:S-protein homolog n=1 Tax=Gossypium mustelinum TaxID=34275 RepID=A0A5D2V4E9_GOSMU|nr:hypothetical protein E1A91_D05G345600v1 [Gossypium mustelinum]
MNASSINWLLSLMHLFVASETILPRHKVDVLIYNYLQNGTDLTVHCKSKDDDLGVHLLAFRNYYEFKFRPNLFGTTLFYCSMQWDGRMHWLDIYTSERDTCTYCLWNVKPEGPCLVEYKKVTCYSWNTDA